MTVNFQFWGTDLDTLMIPKSYLTSIGLTSPQNINQVSYNEASSLWLWGGAGTYTGGSRGGALGNNSSISVASSPVQTVAGGTNWKSVYAGSSGTVAAIRLDGSLWMWGNGAGGEMGDNTQLSKSSPVQTIAGGNNWSQVAVGVGNSLIAHVGAVKTDGTLWMWGTNTLNCLGDGTTISRSSPVQTIAGGTNWRQVSCGQYSTSAIKADGSLWLWGYNAYGTLGDGTNVGKSSPVQTISQGNNWRQVSTGYRQTGAVKTDGTLWMWGYGVYGQLGDNTLVTKSSPVQTIAQGTNWKQVSCGAYTSAAIKTDGSLWLWGNGQTGTLGDNTTTAKSSPVQTIAAGTNWWKVQLIGNTNCAAIKTDGSLWTWGANTYGQLGNNVGSTLQQSSPVQTIAGGYNWRAIGGGPSIYISCVMGAVKDEAYFAPPTTNLQSSGVDIASNYIPATQFRAGNLWSWGFNSNGMLGDNTTVNKSSPVQTISQGGIWTQIAIGSNSTRAIKSNGTLWTWGGDSFNYGTLGDNTNSPKSSPIQTSSVGNNWVYTGQGYQTGAGIKADGTLWTWGIYDFGVNGSGIGSANRTPTQFYSSTWRQVSMSNSTAVGIDSSNRLWTWGSNNYGQLGNNTNTNSSSPVQTVALGSNWLQATAGGGYVAGIKSDGTLWTWGYNSNGQLGDNTTIAKSSPVQTIAGGTNWKQVSANVVTNNPTIVAIKTDGTLWTWGANNYGQLGDNTTIAKSSPVQTVAGGTNWLRAATGGRTLAAIKNDGTLWTWGANNYGQLGNNTTIAKSSPVQTVAGGTNWAQVAVSYYHVVATTYI